MSVPQRLSLITFCLLLIGCAQQGTPPGGPEDKTGPVIRSSFPHPGDVRVPRDAKPWILLNEYPQRASVVGSIFVSPTLEGELETKVKGKRIEVRFPQVLPENRTIVITFGTGLKDFVGNPLPAPFVLAFSTGDSLDQASLEGSISEMEKPGAIWIWAYPLDSAHSWRTNPDPTRDKAPFASQPDDQGHFRLTYLPVGTYRVFAVADARSDRIWQSQTEALAIPDRDVVSAVENPPHVNLRMVLRDLVPPKLIGAEAIHRQGIRLSFNEPVIAAGAKVQVTSQFGHNLSIIYAYQNPADSSALLLTTAIQRDDIQYQVRLDSLLDRAGNVGDSLVIEVSNSTKIDTIGPKLSWSRPVHGDSDVDLQAGIQVGFNEAITLTDLPRAIILRDSVTSRIGGVWKYLHPAMALFTPETPLKAGTTYAFTVWGDSLRDIFGTVSPDSLASLVFTTVNPDNFGAISGQVQRTEPDLRIVAESLEPKSTNWEAVVSAEGFYRLENLPGSDYRLWLYLDRDRDQRWSTGILMDSAITFAEPYLSARDSVRVRSGWETEGVNVEWISQ